MIESRYLQNEVHRRLNRAGTNFSQKLSVDKLDSMLNEALQIWVLNRAKYAEVNSEFRMQLRDLEEKEIELKITKVTPKYVIAEYPKNLLKPLRHYCVASKEDCGEKELIIRIFQSQKLSESLKDPFLDPSFEFEETIGDESKKGLYVFHNNKFNVNSVLIDYIRKPRPLATPSLTEKGYYMKGGVKIDKDSNLELESVYQAKDIVEITALIAMRDTQDYTEYESQLSKILNVDKI
jgi:hypothetical protein